MSATNTVRFLNAGSQPALEDVLPKKYQNGKLRVREDVSRPYYVVKVTEPVIVNGVRTKRRIDKPCGFLDETTHDQAMAKRAEILESVNSHRRLATSLIYFRDLSKRYLTARVPTLASSTQAWEKTQIKNHIEPMFGPMLLSKIDKFSIEQWLTSKDKLSWWTKDGLKHILARMFNAAKEWGWYEQDNPVHGIRLGRKRVVYQHRLLTMEQFRLVLAKLSERTRFLVLVVFGLGLRISEALGLRWEDVDLEAGTVAIRRRWHRGDLSEDLKSETSAAVMRLGASLLAEFKSRYPGAHRRAEFLFLGEDGKNPPDDRDLGRFELRPALKAAGCYTPGNLWHAFRRMHITFRQQIGGATPLEAQKAARHASLDLTYLYTLTDAERETAQQQAMFEKLMEIPMEGKPQ